MKTRSKATRTLRAMLARSNGFGASPNKQRPGLCGHGGIACHLATPPKMAQKNGGMRSFTHPPFPWPLSSLGLWLLQFSILFRPGR